MIKMKFRNIKNSSENFLCTLQTKTIIISIVDVEDDWPNFDENIVDIIYNKFDDVDYDEDNVMTREQAEDCLSL